MLRQMGRTRCNTQSLTRRPAARIPAKHVRRDDPALIDIEVDGVPARHPVLMDHGGALACVFDVPGPQSLRAAHCVVRVWHQQNTQHVRTTAVAKTTAPPATSAICLIDAQLVIDEAPLVCLDLDYASAVR